MYVIVMDFNRGSQGNSIIVSYETEEAANKACYKLNKEEEREYTYRVEKVFHIRA